MSIIWRLFLTHLAVVLIALLSMLVLAEVLAPRFYQQHILEMQMRTGDVSHELHNDLEQGLRSTLTAAMLTALPLAVALAVLTAYFASRRVSRSVRLLSEGSRDIAQGNYARRLPQEGQDELAHLALHFNHMAQALQNVEKNRVELIATVAHELRTPLAALQGYAESLSDGVFPAEQAAQRIAKEVRGMSRLVSDLALVSRVEAGAFALHPQTLDANRFLQEEAQRFAEAFAAKGLGFSTQWSNLPPLYCDPERLQQVLSNLLSNALRYASPASMVVLGAEAQHGGVRIWVKDDGPGIAEADQKRIFERFVRLDPARGRSDGGSGVGLTVAKGLVEAMGGHMGLESQVGEGSTFWFWLPKAP